MKTNLEKLYREMSEAQAEYLMASPPLPWKKRDDAHKAFMEEMKRVTAIIEKIEEH